MMRTGIDSYQIIKPFDTSIFVNCCEHIYIQTDANWNNNTREFVIFAIQAFSYFIGYRVLFKYYDRRDAEIKKFKIILCIISIFIFSAVTNIISGAKYSHGFNIFGVEFIFA